MAKVWLKLLNKGKSMLYCQALTDSKLSFNTVLYLKSNLDFSPILRLQKLRIYCNINI